MSIQRIFSSFIGIIALIGVIGAHKLPFLTSAKTNINAGFAPFFSFLGLLLCAIYFFVTDKSEKKYGVRTLLSTLLKGNSGKAFVFFLFNILMLILLQLLGPAIGMLIFSILACIGLKRMTLPRLMLFSVVWVGVIYLVFVVLLKIPFESGVIFEMLRYA